VIDRGVDPVALMATQLTYGGLLDEVYGHDEARFPPHSNSEEASELHERPSILKAITGKRDASGDKGWSAELDPIWQEIRDLPIAKAQAKLQSTADELNGLGDKLAALKARLNDGSGEEMMGIVERLQSLNERRNRLSEIAPYLEDSNLKLIVQGICCSNPNSGPNLRTISSSSMASMAFWGRKGSRLTSLLWRI